MSGFAWADRHGVRHNLNCYTPMLNEAEKIAQEIDNLLPDFESVNRSRRDNARGEIQARQERLLTIKADVERWNEHASEDTRRAARELLQAIEGFRTACTEICLIVALHDEHIKLFMETRDLPHECRRALEGPPTSLQLQALDIAKAGAGRPDNLNRAQIWSWLSKQARFHRRWTDDGGWFTWTDPDGLTHLLAGPFAIERRIVATIVELEAMRDDLSRSGAMHDLFLTVERALASVVRLTRLKHDLERFDRDADARDLIQCKAFADDWRSKKKDRT